MSINGFLFFAAERLGIPEKMVQLASTGVIGEQLNLKRRYERWGSK